MQLLSANQRCVAVPFSDAVFVTCYVHSEKKKALSLRNQLMALPQLSDSPSRLTKISDMSEIHRTV